MKTELYDASTGTMKAIDIPSSICRSLVKVCADQAGNWRGSNVVKVPIVYELQWMEMKEWAIRPDPKSMKFTNKQAADKYRNKIMKSRRRVSDFQIIEHKDGLHECYS